MANRLDDFESSYNTISVDNDDEHTWRYYFPVTIEPAVFLFCFGSTMTMSISTNLFLVHTCENSLHYNHTICMDLVDQTVNNSKELEAVVQHETNYYTMGKSMIETFIPAILSFYIGAWSDVNGRKPLIMWPLVGYATSYALLLVGSLFSALPTYALMLTSLPPALTGGFFAVLSGSYSYISDISSATRRTLRIAMVDAALFCGLLLGMVSVSYIYKAAGQWGFVTVFSLGTTFCTLAWIYCCFFVEESVVNNESKYPCCCLTSGLFNNKFVVSMMRTCFEKRPDYGRAIILMLTVVLVCGTCVIDGESSVVFLFTREKFGWDLRDYTLFTGIALAINIVGLAFGTCVLTSWLNLPPAPLSAFACFLKILACVVATFSPAYWYLYVGAVLSLVGACVGPWCRSIISNSVPREEIGKIFALVGSLQSLMPLAATPLFTLVYNATLQSFPGLFFLISCGFYILMLILLLCTIIFQAKKKADQYCTLLSEEAPSNDR